MVDAPPKSRRLTKKEFRTNLKRQMEKRVPLQLRRCVTAYQIYMALHDLVVEFDGSVSVNQIQRRIVETDRTVSELSSTDLRRDIMQTLAEGIVSNWCRCTNPGYFKPTSDPPEKTDVDRNKEKMVTQVETTNSGNVDPPRNIILHGEVDNEDEVPGFVISVDEFVAFMKRAQEADGANPPVKC